MKSYNINKYGGLLSSSTRRIGGVLPKQLIILCISLLLAIPAAAEVTKRAVKLKQSPGVSSKTTSRVGAGVKVTIISKRGSWAKIKAGGKKGWVKRSSIAKGEPEAPKRKARKKKTRKKAFVKGRSKKRSSKKKRAPKDRRGRDVVSDDDDDGDFIENDDDDIIEDDDEEDDRPSRLSEDDEEDEVDELLGSSSNKRRKKNKKRREREKKAERKRKKEEKEERERKRKKQKRVMYASASMSLFSKPRSASEEITELEKGERLRFVKRSRSGSWLYVKTDYGDKGWIRKDELESTAYNKFDMRLDAGLGFSANSSKFATDTRGNDAPLSAYNISSSTGNIDISVDGHYLLDEKKIILFDLGYTYGVAVPGIKYNDGTTVSKIGYSTQALDVGAGFGYIVGNRQGVTLVGRLGYHWDHFAVKNVGDTAANPARLPSENFQGPTIGAGINVPKLTSKLGLALHANAMPLLAKRSQTQGLEDGASSKATAIFSGLRLSYAWKDSWIIKGQYQYTYGKTVWNGLAENGNRGHMATKAARADQAHAIILGLGLDL